MLNPCMPPRYPSNNSIQSLKKRKTAAESDDSNTELFKEASCNSNSLEVEDWIQKEKKIEIQGFVDEMGAHVPQRQHFKLPDKNYANKWSFDFPVVYHQYPPHTNTALQQQNVSIIDKIQPQMSHSWNKGIDTKFNNIFIHDLSPKNYYSPVPYGFDVDRSRIIVGDRKMVNYTDCTFKQFITKFNRHSKEDQNIDDDEQLKGIRLTCGRLIFK